MHLTLQIKKRDQNEAMVLLVLAIVFCLGLFLDLLHLPDAVKYTADAVWLLLFVTIVVNRFRMPNAEAGKLLIWIIAFWIITLIGFAINLKSPLYYLWGFRNNFRFFVYFFACVMFLKERTAEEMLNAFDKLFYLNFAVILIQFFVFGIKMDYLGGVFGTGIGCNGKMTLFLSIITTRSILNYINQKEPLLKCLLKCAVALVVAALAEMKFFFVLFIFLLVLVMLITKSSVKKVWIITVAGVGIYAGVSLLMLVFPEFSGFFNVKWMLKSATTSKGYTGQGDMNRLTAIPIVWEKFFLTWPERLFGLGLGNCDTSAFSFLNTSFYEQYGHLHYNWFSSSFMFLETGIVGLAVYLSFFVLIYLYARKRERTGEANRDYCQLVRIMAMICFLLIIYNGSMRLEEAYIMYFVLALPFIKRGKSRKEGEICAEKVG